MSNSRQTGSVFSDYNATIAAEKHLLNNQTNPLEDVQNGDLVIAVMDRGWVFIGFIMQLNNGKIRLDCCHNIHRWGTTKGLGEIAINGPTSETQLHPCEPIYGTPIFLMKASDKWL